MEVLQHLEAALPGTTRLSHQKFDDGHKLKFDNGERIDGVQQLTEAEVNTANLVAEIRTMVDEQGADAFSVEPYVGKEPDSLKVTLFRLGN